ncbi:MAG TPA: hypothetical protein VIF62_05425 [Labilithrix sp.]
MGLQAAVFSACAQQAQAPVVATVEAPDAGATVVAAAPRCPGPSDEVTYDTSAPKLLARGDELAAKGCLDAAAETYERLVKLFPYSQVAKVGELRIADVDSKRGDWTRAVDRYDAWLRAHPTAPDELLRQAKAGADTARCRGAGRSDCD